MKFGAERIKKNRRDNEAFGDSNMELEAIKA